jgi:hypothetical protein
MAITPRHRVLSDEYVRQIALQFVNPLILAIPEEWRAITGIPGRVHKCDDLLEMACLINRAPLFIGTPSLASAIAEGLKVPRIVDLPSIANAFPIGPRGYVIPSRLVDFQRTVRHLTPGGATTVPSLRGDAARSAGDDFEQSIESGFPVRGELRAFPAGGLIPIGYVDAPLDRQIVKGTLVASGWAVSEDRLSDVAIYVDRRYFARATLGLARPDVAKLFSWRFLHPEDPGWRAEIDTGALDRGPHELIFQALSRKGVVGEIGTRTIIVGES